MFNKEEEKLQDYKKMYDNIPVSIESLDAAIMAGFQRAKIEEVKKPRPKKWIYSFVAAAVLLIGFLTSVRLSPALADYVTVLPGMEKIVEMLRFDKGKMSAIENDYYQEIGALEKKKGLEVIIDGAIADENGLVLFYTLTADQKQKNLFIEHFSLASQDGEKLNYSEASYNPTHSSTEGKNSYNGTIEYFFEEPFNASELELNLIIKGDIVGEYKIPFNLNKDIEVKKTYKLNKTISIEGQNITFLSATIQPLRVAINVKKDPNNTKKILNFDDLRLVDENGETWNKISNGTTARKISENEEIIYLQSNYFRQPEELYLALNKLQAIDKEEAFVVVDVEKEEIIKQPKGNILTDVEVKGSYIDFTMPIKDEFPYFLFSRILDGEGKDINAESSSSDMVSEEEIIKSFGINIPNLKKQKGPISLELSFFPAWIEGDVKVRLK
jgi:hypothetical protein